MGLMLDKGEKQVARSKAQRVTVAKDIEEQGSNNFVMDLGFDGVVQCLEETKSLNENVHHEFIKQEGK